MKFFNLAAGLLMITAGSNVLANTAQCVDVPIGGIKELYITPTNKFINCFYIDQESGASGLTIFAQSFNLSSFSLSELALDSSGQLGVVGSTSSDENATLSVVKPSLPGRMFFSIKPTGLGGKPKNISFSAAKVDGGYVIVVGITDIVKPYQAPPSTPQPPPEDCSNPRKHCANRAQVRNSSAQAVPSCSAAATPPSDKNPKFNVNAHLQRFSSARDAIERLPSGVSGATKAMVMTSLFYSKRKYDLKQSPDPDMLSGQAFGNWFFGAAAAEIGYTREQTLKAGAIVQQVQNFTYENNPAYQDVGAMAMNILAATRTGQGDNPGDAELISGGFDYVKDVFAKDLQRGMISDSCSRKPAVANGEGDAGGSVTYEYPSRWTGYSAAPWPSCIGKCGPAYGEVFVGPLNFLQSN
jgi:hypothetical protein